MLGGVDNFTVMPGHPLAHYLVNALSHRFDRNYLGNHLRGISKTKLGGQHLEVTPAVFPYRTRQPPVQFLDHIFAKLSNDRGGV